MRANLSSALARMGKEQAPLLYWTAAAWGSAISLAMHDAELSADLALVASLMDRALALDEGYGLGSIHDFFISYDGGRPPSAGGSAESAERHMHRALELAQGKRVAPLVSYAETVLVGAQKKEEFTRLLNEAIALDPNRWPDQRLANLVSQKRARWLLSRTDQLFID
jgi:predicted anti-sigma-YlaC factor YlaD